MKIFKISFNNEEINLYNRELKDLRDRWNSEGIESFSYIDSRGNLTLSSIIVPKEKRNMGIGTQKMKELLNFAKERGLRVLLSPSTDLGATSKGRLEKFYRNLGFEKNKGRNKDFTTQESMIWDKNENI